MTKKITQFFIGAAILASVATADTDLFAKLSNGAMSDKSEGITELNREQKAKVVGGYYIHTRLSLNEREGNILYPYAYRTGFVFALSSREKEGRYACWFNGNGCDPNHYINRQRYQQYASLVNVNTEELVLVTRHSYRPRYYTQFVGVVNQYSGKIKRSVSGAITQEILRDFGAEAIRHNENTRIPR